MTLEATTYVVDLAAVGEAARRIAPYAHRTSVLTSGTLDDLARRRLFFKCENFQRVGAFKFRGACNAVMKLPDDQAARGVVTHSSGNHAQAIALACRLRGIEAHIVMPNNAMAVKREAVAGYGGHIYLCEPTPEGRRDMGDQVQRATGAVMIPPFDHPDIIAGQGTAALELLDERPDLDAIIAPVGGGGLMSGTCIAATGIKPGIGLFAAEPAGADDAARSLAAGRLIPQTGPNTICDGLLTSLGERTWPIIRDHLQRVITPTDGQTIAAMRLVWERMKIIIEASAAVTVAAVLTDEFKSLPGLNRVGVILSGGNVALDRLPW